MARTIKSIIVAALVLAVAGCQQSSLELTSVRELQESRARIEAFFELGSAPELMITPVAIAEDHYWVLTNRRRNKTVVLDVGESFNSPPRELGFFGHQSGEWVRDPREKFEMHGGVWLLERFRDVIKRSEQNTTTRRLDWTASVKQG